LVRALFARHALHDCRGTAVARGMGGRCSSTGITCGVIGGRTIEERSGQNRQNADTPKRRNRMSGGRGWGWTSGQPERGPESTRPFRAVGFIMRVIRPAPERKRTAPPSASRAEGDQGGSVAACRRKRASRPAGLTRPSHARSCGAIAHLSAPVRQVRTAPVSRLPPRTRYAFQCLSARSGSFCT
jgi:hypothetical protein